MTFYNRMRLRHGLLWRNAHPFSVPVVLQLLALILGIYVVSLAFAEKPNLWPSNPPTETKCPRLIEPSLTKCTLRKKDAHGHTICVAWVRKVKA
jgi:hypothetical protein